MSVFNKILLVSKQIAASLVKNEYPNSLEKADVFSEDDREYILKKVTDPLIIKDHQLLKKTINTQSDWLKVKPKKNVRKIYWQYIAAASVALIVSVSIYTNKDKSIYEINEAIIVNNQIKRGSDKAILTLGDGLEVTLVKGETYQVKNAISNGGEIVYKKIKQAKKEIVYNYLTVPRGGQYQIVLSDNTKVWLNSESQLKYPVSFSKGAPRKVELMYGEAYFDVSPSTEHDGSSFKVYTKNQEVKVFGTEFNIKAYRNETMIYTTLVEGSVLVTSGLTNKFLVPLEQASLNLVTNNVVVKKVNIYDETSWKNGVFSFNQKNLKEIMQVLSRWYDMEVIFENKELENVGFNGVLDKNQQIQEILESIKRFGIAKNYEINNKSIIIK
jgi:hypothetical protein